MAVRRGVWVVVFLLVSAVLVSAALVAFSWVAFRRAPGVPAKGVLVLKIQGNLEEISTNPFDSLLQEAVTVRSITAGAPGGQDRPARHRRPARPIEAPSLWGKVQELRDALVDFRSSGKPLVAFLEFAGDREYVLASAASRVVLVPPGQLNLTGLASYQVFLRGTFDKIGVQPDLLHIGDYKTAVNTFTEKGFTPAHREMTESLNHDAFEQLIGAIASARKKSVEDVRALVDQGPMLPEAALQNGLVDDVAYFDEMGKTSGLGDRFTELPLEQYLVGDAGDAFGPQRAARGRPLRRRHDRLRQRRHRADRHRGRLGQAHRVHPRRPQRRQHQGGGAARSTALADRRWPPT